MFKAGESVVYGTHGVCVIKEISLMDFGGDKREYYILAPVYDESSTFYVPTDNAEQLGNMRSVLTLQQIDELILSAADRDVKWIEDDTKRKDFCNSTIKLGSRDRLMQMVEMLYLRQEDLKGQKKHIHIADERFLKTAEKMLHDEISYVVGIPREDVPAYITGKIESK